MVTLGANTALDFKLKTSYSRTSVFCLFWTFKEFHEVVTDFHAVTCINLEMSTRYEKTISLSATANSPPNVNLSKLCSPSYSLQARSVETQIWEKERKRRKFKQAHSWSLLVQLLILLSTNKVNQSGGRRLVFKGFTVCSQGRQQWLTAALSLLGMPVVAVLPSSSLTHLEYTEANFPLIYSLLYKGPL